MYTKLEKEILGLGLLDIQKLDDTIDVDLKYASEDNFMGEILYHDLHHAFLVEELAVRVVNANKVLRTINNAYRIVIYDAARPLSVQQKMYDKVKGTPWEKYVANPNKQNRGGFHNYGMAVDLSIKLFEEVLDMGSPFDSFEETSHTDVYNLSVEKRFLKEEKITFDAYNNRIMLYEIMRSQELYPIPREWWHFQYFQKEEEKNYFKLLDF